MVKCPYCGFGNEDGTLFCEQCKSDLSASPDNVPMAQPVAAGAAAEAGAGDVSSAASVEPPPPVAAPEADVAAAAAIALHEQPTVTPQAAAEQPTFAERTSKADDTGPSLQALASSGQAATDGAVGATPIAEGSHPKLVVLRGLRMNVEYPLYEGENYIGRTDEKPVDIDLEDQEPPDRIWSSRQHAIIHYVNNTLIIEDLNSANGTFVNRTRVYPGQKRGLQIGDVVQIGTVHLRVKG
jgi:hypothetical protein